MKDHEKRELINKLRDIAVQFAHTQQLRQRIAEVVLDALAEHEKEQEPVAYDVQKALYRAYVLGQKYWADADSESYSRNKRADKHRQDFETLCEEALFCTAPPRREWQGLTDEEKETAYDLADMDVGDGIAWVDAKLKEKNRG